MFLTREPFKQEIYPACSSDAKCSKFDNTGTVWANNRKYLTIDTVYTVLDEKDELDTKPTCSPLGSIKVGQDNGTIITKLYHKTEFGLVEGEKI